LETKLYEEPALEHFLIRPINEIEKARLKYDLKFDPKYTEFLQECEEICSDDEKFKIFRRMRSCMGVIENVTHKFGIEMINECKKTANISNYPWETFQQNEKVGLPYTCDFKDQLYFLDDCEFSPTTFRFINNGTNIIQHLRNLNLKTVRIIEIGGGYGAQAVILLELAKTFNLNIEDYCIIDLEEVTYLQNKYLTAVKKEKDVECLTIEELNLDKNFNFLISNYAFGEFNDHWKNLYIDRVIKRIAHGYLIWNFSSHSNKIHEFFLNLPKVQIEEEKPQTNTPPIKSFILKY